MTPDQLARTNSEHGHQRALFAWANMAVLFGFNAAWDDRSYNEPNFARNTYGQDSEGAPHELARMHAIANGGKRDKITAGKLKAEGVKAGVPDIFLPVPMPMSGLNRWDKRHCGLYIEMKRPKAGQQTAGSTSNEQETWIVYLRSAGYAVGVYFDWRSAAKDIQQYMEGVYACNQTTDSAAQSSRLQPDINRQPKQPSTPLSEKA